MDDSTAVVTGASHGIGAAVAREFAAHGAHVVCGARDRDALDTCVERIRADGGEATAVRTDVRDEYDVERLLETAARVGGSVDTVVANAAVNHGDLGETPLHEESYARFDDTFRTNVRGVFATVREAVPHLSADARILVPSEQLARDATPRTGAYAASKAAAEAVARGFRADLDTPVLVVDPGPVATDLHGGTGPTPADAAPIFRWAATEARPAEIDDGLVDLSVWRRATE